MIPQPDPLSQRFQRPKPMAQKNYSCRTKTLRFPRHRHCLLFPCGTRFSFSSHGRSRHSARRQRATTRSGTAAGPSPAAPHAPHLAAHRPSFSIICRCVSAVSGLCLGCVWAVSGLCLGRIRAVSGLCLGCVWAVLWQSQAVFWLPGVNFKLGVGYACTLFNHCIKGLCARDYWHPDFK